MSQCWVIGDAAIDLIREGNTQLELPGGTGANVSVALSRLGVRTALITKLGNDPHAALLVDKLKRENVNTQHISYSDGYRTGVVGISVDSAGEREFTFMEKPSADSQLESSDIPAFERGEWLCVSSFMLSQRSSREATLHAIKQAKMADLIVCVDANMRIDRWDDRSLLVPTTTDALKMADIAKMSEHELFLLANTDSVEEGIEKVKRWPARIKIITRAQKGAILLTGQSEFQVEGFNVPVVDMTGAGDAFIAAFISKLMPLENWSDAELIEAVEFSNACGALVVGKKGAMSALPNLVTLNRFIKEKGSECLH
ncbi:MAG: aminoimidazole riboside kinase [Proteobacteria bacterium]|nr:aminoimidazole riboside kinase [Pseudomonadota bacterium]